MSPSYLSPGKCARDGHARDRLGLEHMLRSRAIHGRWRSCGVASWCTLHTSPTHGSSKPMGVKAVPRAIKRFAGGAVRPRRMRRALPWAGQMATVPQALLLARSVT